MATPYTSYSPQQLEDGVQFSDDKHYALHGKIMLLVIVITFSLFLMFILMIPCLKNRVRRSHESETDGSDSIAGRKRRSSKEDITEFAMQR
ncbi:putative transmembrane protein [Sesbania bispinosa]|nr:putative transmembrane protein [Sesbania bispinosa]